MSQDNPVHLLRGAPAVRSWSKYQSTVPEWTLCGIRRVRRKNREPTPATEDAAAVTCRFCRMLMATTAKTLAKASPHSQERKATAG